MMGVLLGPVAAHAVLQKGQPPPPIKVTTTSGQQVTLDNYRGKVLVLDFFATWCVPCRKTFPHLMGLSRKFGKQGLHIIGMSLDEGGEKIVKEFIITNKLTYPVAIVGDDLTSVYGIRSLPAMVVISKKGIVAERFQGFNDDVAQKMDSLIKKLLAE
jgi:thiol-disulfide isomerase/thioredoxin